MSMLPLNFLLTAAILCVPALGDELPEAKFRAVEIDDAIKIGYGLALADVDGDRKTDVVLVDKTQVVWYQNPKWTKHVIAENLTQRDNVCVAARDINGDGKAEIAVGAEWNPGDTLNSGAVFYLEPPADRTRKWKPIKLKHEPTTHRMRWVRNAWDSYELVVLPLHGRGNQGGRGAGVKVLSYRMPGNLSQPWSTSLIDDSMHKTHNFDVVQWDDHPAEELLIAGAEGVYLSDWRDGAMRMIRVADDVSGGAGEVRLGRIPGNTRCVAAIEPMHGSQFVAYTPPSSGELDGIWSRHMVDNTLASGHAIAAGDMLGAGFDQFVVGWRSNDRRGKVGIKLYTPLDRTGKKWRVSLVDDNTVACEDLRLADLNNDGRLDIVAAGRATKNVKIFYGVK